MYYRGSVESERIAATNANNANNATPKPNGALLVRPDSPTIGPADAKVTLVEFYDPECETCAEFGPIVKRIVKDYNGRMRYVARFMPLHPNSLTAANFISAAGEQGKYWEAMELLFEKQPEWGTKHGPQPPPDPKAPTINQMFDKYARELGLDTAQAAESINARKFQARIDQDKADGQALGVRRTPTFLINGRELTKFSEAGLREMIDMELGR
jgi:protein-disulfide isomerase